LRKTKWLENNASTKSYIPETKLFTKTNLETLIHRYTSVYFKPVTGSGGVKIVKLMYKDGQFTAKHNKTTRSFNSVDDLYKWMQRFTGNRKFLLQRGIKLLKTNNNPFDVRVMMQRNEKNSWVPTAIFCKVGKPGKVATNYNQGGHLQYLNKTLIGAGYSDTQIKQVRSELSKLGRDVANVFSSKSKGFKELGLDIAIDDKKQLWILEVNTRPQFYPLKKFKNKSLYNKIVSYAKLYGRTK